MILGATAPSSGSFSYLGPAIFMRYRILELYNVTKNADFIMNFRTSMDRYAPKSMLLKYINQAIWARILTP